MAAAEIISRPLLVAVIVGSVVACAAPSPTVAPTGVIALRTLESPPPGTPEACMAARTEGTLVRESRSGVGLQVDSDRVYQVIWPYGYSARDDDGRLALLDSTGKVVAHEGDHVAVGGGEREAGIWIGCGGIIPPL